ncbi:MAG: tetratricopeptide repeat protein, partial [Proteobacteria bacterium]|nr:tetratricopeptide repeat protein [Pseudomonadota bacterium]
MKNKKMLDKSMLHRRRWVTMLTVLLALSAACTQDPASQLEAAKAHVAANDYATAVIGLKNLLQAEPDYVQGRLLLAEVSLALGDPLSAEKELTRARELGASAVKHMALHYRIQTTLGKNAAVLELLAMDGGTDGLSDVQEQDFRGIALLGLGSSMEAEASFRAALVIDATSARSRWGLAAAIAAQGRTDEARTEIQTLINDHPQFARGWLLKGLLALRAGLLAHALEVRVCLDP